MLEGRRAEKILSVGDIRDQKKKPKTKHGSSGLSKQRREGQGRT